MDELEKLPYILGEVCKIMLSEGWMERQAVGGASETCWSYVPALLNQVLPTTVCEARATTAAVASENLIFTILSKCQFDGIT